MEFIYVSASANVCYHPEAWYNTKTHPVWLGT